MPTELDYIGPTEDCPRPELWSSYDGAASEKEVGEFLHGLVRILKPLCVVETGSYLGYTTYQIADALLINGRGVLISCDVNENYVTQARQRCAELPVLIHHRSGIDVIRDIDQVDLAFIDSGGDRAEEVKVMKLSKHGIIVLHDARHKEYAGRLFSMLYAKAGWNKLFIPTPRGLAIFQKES